MDAPVPASALIHSATLVSAGVYLILRFFDILQLSGLMPLVGVLGALTSAYGGIVAGLQTDLKRALAYSTISHCGFLFTFVSLGGSSAALLYLFLHGFFKAMSFICAGEFIRVSGGYQDLNRMGSGFFQAPSLSSQFLIAMGNLCGIPFFVGYYFKSNFQNFVLASGDFNQITGVLFLTGLLCSLFYFFKVYYCVVFSFRKLNFKLLQESLKRNRNFFQHPIKSPKAVMVIFWAIMLVSLICVFWYFPHNKELLVCNITDAYTSPLSHFSSISKTPLTRHTQVNYLFVFYTFFICTIVALLSVYSSRRCGWPYLINSLFLAASALLLSFAFFSVS
jgi:NADH:ubiquinone oxidoreductase subunit 5 (subunit L)/multisubunit Na+/H+ antiporter MnhA subunit